MDRKKKLSEVVKLYGNCIMNPLFEGGRPSKTFWRLRAFFNKQDDSRLDNILLYLQSFDRCPVMSLTTLIEGADKFNRESKWQNDRAEAKPIKKEEPLYNIDSFLEL